MTEQTLTEAAAKGRLRIDHTLHETLVSIEHVSLSYDGRLILRDVNAVVRNIRRPDCVQGQVVCFLGPSGIGKTQLSRIIAGLNQPTTGRVLLADGKPVKRGRVGMVAQNYPLFEFATVLENFEIASRHAPQTTHFVDITDKAKAYVEQFDLGQYLKHYPCQLSGGTRQRVAIVRQLLCSEHLLVLDEPFSGLDLIMKQRACGLITQVANLDELNTIILVTHDVTEGMSVADKVWLMGREEDKPGATLVEQYDLAEMGLCWREGLATDPEFMRFVGHVKDRFQTLSEGARA